MIKRLAAGIALSVALLSPAACQSGGTLPTGSNAVKGGTLHVMNGDDVDYGAAVEALMEGMRLEA